METMLNFIRTTKTESGLTVTLGEHADGNGVAAADQEVSRLAGGGAELRSAEDLQRPASAVQGDEPSSVWRPGA